MASRTLQCHRSKRPSTLHAPYTQPPPAARAAGRRVGMNNKRIAAPLPRGRPRPAARAARRGLLSELAYCKTRTSLLMAALTREAARPSREGAVCY